MKNGFDNVLINEKQKIGSFFNAHSNLTKIIDVKSTKKDIEMITSNIMTEQLRLLFLIIN